MRGGSLVVHRPGHGTRARGAGHGAGWTRRGALERGARAGVRCCSAGRRHWTPGAWRAGGRWMLQRGAKALDAGRGARAGAGRGSRGAGRGARGGLDAASEAMGWSAGRGAGVGCCSAGRGR